MTRYADLSTLRRAIADSDVRILDDAESEPVRTVHRSTAPTEHDEQVALMQMVERLAAVHPKLDLLMAYPIGGYRSKATAAKIKAEGGKAGVPDLFLPCARGGYHGMFLELKRADHSNDESRLQVAWRKRLTAEGYHCVVAYGAVEAMQSILEYIAKERE